jgi:hypothetical protein
MVVDKQTNWDVIRDGHFVVMKNYHLFNREMTDQAKGLLSRVFALPASWVFSVKG